jgi:holo-[acyl-carrier protein] synthase
MHGAGNNHMKGVGIDAVDVARFRNVLARRPAIAQRLFTDAELSGLSRRTDSAASLAARFAVREATMKALGVGLGAFDFHDVWVENMSSGAPMLRVTGRAQEIAESQGVSQFHVSITHTDTVAMAVVAAL